MKTLLFFLALVCSLSASAQLVPDCNAGICAGVGAPTISCHPGAKYAQADAPGTNWTCTGIPAHWVQDAGSGGGQSQSQTSVAQPTPSSTTFLQAANNGANQIVRVGVKGDSFTIDTHQGGGGPGDGPLIATNRWAEQLRIKGQSNWGSHGTGVYPIIIDNAGDLNGRAWTCTGTTDHSNLSLGPYTGSVGSLLHMTSGAACTFSDSRNLAYTNLSVYYATPTTTSSLAIVADGGTSMGTATSANSTQAGAANAGLTARRYDSATTLPATTHSIVYTCTGDCYIYANDGVNGTTGFSVDLEGINGATAATFGASTANQLAFDALIPGGEQALIYMDQTNDANNSVSTSTFSTQITNIITYEQVLPSTPTVMLAIPPVDVISNTHSMAAYTAVQLGLCTNLNLTCVNIQSRGTTIGSTSVGWGTSYNSANGLWDLTGSNPGVHPNDAGNLDEFQMIYAQLLNPVGNTANTSATMENIYSAAGSFTFAHNLNSIFNQVHCVTRTGSTYAPATWTDFPVDANDTTVTVTAAGDYICSFNSSGALPFPTPVVVWLMNEGSGTTFLDTSNGGNNETFTSGIGSWGTVSGLPGTVYTFNGTGGATGTNTTATAFTGATPFSISMWVKPTTVTGFTPLLSTIQGTSPFTGWDLGEVSTGVLQFRLINTYPSNVLDTNQTSLPTGSLTHVVVTYDGSKSASGVQVYYNGAVQTTSPQLNTLTGSIANSNPVEIATDRAGDLKFTSTIAFVRIYAAQLTSAQVSKLYASGPQ